MGQNTAAGYAKQPVQQINQKNGQEQTEKTMSGLHIRPGLDTQTAKE